MTTPQPLTPQQQQQRAAWRKARAAHARAQRRGRHRRAAQQITGIRRPAPGATR